MGPVDTKDRDGAAGVQAVEAVNSRSSPPHPYASHLYLEACRHLDASQLHVPRWSASLLVEEVVVARVRRATGVQPVQPLSSASSDLRAGLDELWEANIASVTLVTDPLFSPATRALQEAFDICRPFKEHYLVDRKARIQIRKRHRNRINHSRRRCDVEEMQLSKHLDRWMSLYLENVNKRKIAKPFSPKYFQKLAEMPELRTIGVWHRGVIVTMTLWMEHADTLYFHESASSAKGYEVFGAYAAFDNAIREGKCRHVELGGSAGIRDDPLDGMTMFKRGFANATAMSYLCASYS